MVSVVVVVVVVEEAVKTRNEQLMMLRLVLFICGLQQCIATRGSTMT